MATNPNRLIQVTDSMGRCLLDKNDNQEPEPGSVVLVGGRHGTAWQRYFNDNRWHSTRGGRPVNWHTIMCKRNVVLVYDALPREAWVPDENMVEAKA